MEPKHAVVHTNYTYGFMILPASPAFYENTSIIPLRLCRKDKKDGGAFYSDIVFLVFKSIVIRYTYLS